MSKETLDHLELCSFAEQTHDINFHNIAKELFREVYFQKNIVNQLNNNWNELEECVESRLMSIPDDMFDDKVEEAKRTTKIAVYQVILGKMKEIKGGSNDKTRTN